ncbi:MAG: hypothetical protein ACFFAZ_15565 [Promethearchaeota archaeon]
MKKSILILTLVALSVLMITPVFANGVTYESDLIAGQDEENPVGLLTITFNDQHTMMYVTYTTTECLIIETHLWYGTDLEDVPRTGSGNPKIGKFPYATENPAGTNEVVYELPVTTGQNYYILAHAVVDCPCIGKETAWGEGPESTMFSENQVIFGSRWGYYLTVWV